MSSTLIRGGLIVTALGRYEADVLAVDGKIVQIGAGLDVAADHVFDARGQYVIPGGVDPHAHMKITFKGVPSADDFTAATIAAAHGGTTTVFDFAFQEFGQPLPDAMAEWHAALAAAPPVTDVGAHLVIRDLTDPARVDELREIPAQGVTSFKLFMAYRNQFMVGDPAMWNTMKVAAETGAIVLVHAENGDAIDALISEALAAGNTAPPFHGTTRPIETEAEAVTRAIMFAELTGAKTYIVHTTCGPAIAPIVAAKMRGLPVYGETCPQYLLHDDSLLQGGDEGLKGIFSPPPRPAPAQDELWHALAGVGLDTIGTDHCAFPYTMRLERLEEDFSKVPNGVPGIEERLELIFDRGVRAGRLTLEQWVDLCCTTPARLMGLGGRKGVIEVGADADLVIWDPERTRTLSVATQKSNCDYNLYEGWQVTGTPSAVIAGGVPLVVDGALVDQPARGFLARGAAVEAAGV